MEQKQNLKKKIEIIKWNVYYANLSFIDNNETKERPVIIIGKMGSALTIIPLTTNLNKQTEFDIEVIFKTKKSLIKVANIQRIHYSKIVRPLYINKVIVNIKGSMRKEIAYKIYLYLIAKNNIDILDKI